MSKQKTFDTDLARMNTYLHKAGAIITAEDGFTFVDPSKVSAQVLSAYQRLTSYGYANGLI